MSAANPKRPQFQPSTPLELHGAHILCACEGREYFAGKVSRVIPTVHGRLAPFPRYCVQTWWMAVRTIMRSVDDYLHSKQPAG